MRTLAAIAIAVNTAFATPALAMSAPTEKPDFAQQREATVESMQECHTLIGAAMFQYRILDRIEFDDEAISVTWNDKAVGLGVAEEVGDMQAILMYCFDLIEHHRNPEN
jgi:hypothetical protein